jgi:hypothetical protein
MDLLQAWHGRLLLATSTGFCWSCYRDGPEAVVRSAIVCTLTLLLAVLSLHGWQMAGRYSQYADEMQNPEPYPEGADEKTEYAFARLRYRGFGRWGRGGWGTDSNTSEHHFIRGVLRLTRVQARTAEEIIDVDSDAMFEWPWLYAVEVGRWHLSDAQARRLRTYLDRGGFLMVDDFHGTYEWESFMASLKRVFPDRPVVEIDNENPIFRTVYDLQNRVQVPGRQFLYSGVTYERDGVEPRWRAVFDEHGRIQVAICHNMDLGDAWEWADDPRYPERYASEAYKIGINYLIYSMTH